MKSKKFLILAITISFPVILYLFLRFFGQNNYDLPIYFQDEGIACNAVTDSVDTKVVKLVHNSDTTLVDSVLNNSMSLVIFPSTTEDYQGLKNELSRTVQNLEEQLDLRLIAFYEEDVPISKMLSLSNIEIDNYRVLGKTFAQLTNCHFKLPTKDFRGKHPTGEVWETSDIVLLVDEDNQIRGYYNGFETKEVDRLILEVNVLLSRK